MVNYNDGKWHGWNGGECPVHPETVVEVRWRSDFAAQTGQAGKFNSASQWSWEEDNTNRIVAFRVIKEHREPREFWVTKQTLFDLDGNVSGYAYHQSSEKDGDFKVREVIE